MSAGMPVVLPGYLNLTPDIKILPGDGVRP